MAFIDRERELSFLVGKRPELQVIVDQPKRYFLARQNTKLNP